MDAQRLQEFFDRPDVEVDADPALSEAHQALLDALEADAVRAAEPGDDGDWHANAWVKRAILAGFRAGSIVEYPGPGFPFSDKSTYPPRTLAPEQGVRLVPGGSSVRRGAFLGRGVVIMPPAYVNVGARVAERAMVDSHALVGSCAQIGAGVHLSAGAQVGGVLEPPGALPVIVEDGAFVGALCGLFEGVLVRERAVLAPGVVLTASTTVFDLVHERERHREIPAGAVVVPGSRPARGEFASQRGIQLAAPVIVKYRDENTAAATALEEALR